MGESKDAAKAEQEGEADDDVYDHDDGLADRGDGRI